MSSFFKFLRNNKIYVVVWVLIFVFFILAPMSGDDYNWSFNYFRISDPGSMLSPIPWMHQSTNGRIIGNALEFFLVSYPILSAIVKSSIMVGILYTFCKITKIKNPIAISLVALLVYLPPVNIFRQAIVWSAGFYNYTVPILLLMLIYLIINTNQKNKYINIILFVLSIMASLFSENVTIVTLGLFCIYGIVKFILHKRINRKIIISVIGLLFGTILMFSSPVYVRVIAGADGYRSLSVPGVNFISRLAENAHDLSSYLVFDILHLYTILFAVIASIYLYNLKINKDTKNISLIISGMSLTLLWFIKGLQNNNGQMSQYLITFITWVSFAALIVCLLNYISKVAITRHYRHMIIGCVIIGILYATPFLLVTPFGPRNFYITYILIIMSIIIALRLVVIDYNHIRLNHKTIYIIAGIIATTVIGLMGINRITYAVNENEAIKQLNEGKTKIYLKSYPIPSLIHDSQSSKKQAPYFVRRYCVYPKCTINGEIEIIYK